MKTFKTMADATRLAAASGATLEAGGRIVNAAGTRMSIVRPGPAVTPAPKPAPVTIAEQPDRATQLIELQARMAASQAQVMAEAMGAIVDRLNAPTQQAQLPPPAVRHRPVSFAVLRNAKGEPTQLVPTFGAGASVRPVSFDLVKDKAGLTTEIIPIY